jgi:uncharacterized protein
MILPTKEQCLQYFEDYNVPKNIKAHCLSVAKVAFFLAKELKKVNKNINVELVHRTALLHDLFKVVVLEKLEPSKQYHPEPYTDKEIATWKMLREKYPNMWESQVAQVIFKDKYPELAVSVGNSSDPHKNDKTWEELIVHYADFRIMQEKIVLLDERLSYLRNRYPASEDAWDKHTVTMKNDESKIFSKINFEPEELKTKLENELNS